jgi:hypothetical protein
MALLIHARRWRCVSIKLHTAAADFNHYRGLMGFKSFSQAIRRGTEIEKNRDYHLCPLPQLKPKKERTI